MSHHRGNGILTGILIVIVTAQIDKPCLLQKGPQIIVCRLAFFGKRAFRPECGSRQPQRQLGQIMIVNSCVIPEPGAVERNMQRVIFLCCLCIKNINQVYGFIRYFFCFMFFICFRYFACFRYFVCFRYFACFRYFVCINQRGMIQKQ